jgi:tetratricopeptide (TPR) repeat protein
MRRWLILAACGLGNVTLPAQVPDPGEISLVATSGPPAPAVLTTPPVAATHAPAPDGRIATATPIQLAANTPASGNDALPQPLAPSPEPAPVSKQAPTPAAKTAETPAPAKEKSGKTPGEVVPDDGGIPDTLYPVPAKQAPDAPEKTPSCFGQVEYLRSHRDNLMAIDYLKKIVTNTDLSPRDRSRSIIELADCLAAEHQESEALCWLKIWTQLFPGRTEFGAVAFRIGTIYTHMGLPSLARDAFYLTLAHTLNEGQMQNDADIHEYQRLTVGTLWALATNEYGAGEWARGAKLFHRYYTEATTGSAISLEKAAFLEADCYYQVHDAAKALSLYEDALAKHPFNILAPEARLRLYHLYLMKGETQKAQDDLESLVWTVRTVWPKDEAYWQKQTAQLLMAINKDSKTVLPPLLQTSSKLAANAKTTEGKTWQDSLNHYDALVGYEAAAAPGSVEGKKDAGMTDVHHHLSEDDDLLALDRNLNQLLPPTDSNSQ